MIVVPVSWLPLHLEARDERGAIGLNANAAVAWPRLLSCTYT